MGYLPEEIIFVDEPILAVDRERIESLKKIAAKNKRTRVRLCTHPDANHNVHEMLIVHSLGTYVRPHKHRINRESLQFIEGVGTAIIFKDDGSIRQAFKVGDQSSDNTFYYSMGKGLFHMLIIESKFLIFKETTKGPFIRKNTIFPNWAPDGNNEEEITAYVSNIKTSLEKTDL